MKILSYRFILLLLFLIQAISLTCATERAQSEKGWGRRLREKVKNAGKRIGKHFRNGAESALAETAKAIIPGV